MTNMKKFNLSIKNPCNANLKEMQKTNSGFFCSLCNKDVFDFTNKSKNEIEAFLNSKKGENACGKFLSSQISTSAVNNFKINLPIKYIFLATLLYGKSVFSQNNPEKTKSKISVHNTQKPTTRVTLGMPAQTLNSFTIKGQLIINNPEVKHYQKDLEVYFLGANKDAIKNDDGNFKTDVALEKDFSSLYIVITHKKEKVIKNIPFDVNKIINNVYIQNIILLEEDYKILNINSK